MEQRVRALGSARFVLGEGPYWDGPNRTLWWVDLDVGDLCRARLDQPEALERIPIGPTLTFAIPCRSGGLVVGRWNTVEHIHDDGTVTVLADVDKGDPDVRLNDGACDARGRLVFGTMNRTRALRTGDLWSLAPDGTLTHLRDGVSLSNGIDWSPDGATLYHVDSDAQNVTAFDYDLDTGAATNPRVLIDVPPEQGLPDGLAVDAAGTLWIAMHAGAAVRSYSPAGDPSGVLDLRDLPVTGPTSVAFAGDDLRTLAITSSTKRLPEGLDQPLAGAVLLHDQDTPGLPAHPFGA